VATPQHLLALIAEHEQNGLAELSLLVGATGMDEVELELELRDLVDHGYLLLAREPGHHDSASVTTAGLRLLRERAQVEPSADRPA
jgi:hypothetical protein